MLIRILRLSAAVCVNLPLLIPAVLKRQRAAIVGRFLARVLAGSAGAFPKFGQVLSTRPDLLPAPLCAELAKLQDEMPPVRSSRLTRLLQAEGLRSRFEAIDRGPVASASIAEVYRAVSASDGREIALKVIRPGVARQIERDCRLAQTASIALERLPAMRSVPIREAVRRSALALGSQTDFRREASNLARLRHDFREWPDIFVPQLYPDLSTGSIVCMEYVPGLKKLTDPAIPDHIARELTKVGLRALYRMIFETGFVHCDLHPGNVMVTPKGQLAILDAGLMTELDDSTRISFGEFFAAIALQNGMRAGEIVRQTAERLPPDLDCEAFDREIAELIKRTGGLSAAHFEVAGFVSDLFAIQAKHGLQGTSRFTLIILALLVYEGIAKQRHPTLDFQKEALPFVVALVFGIRPKRAAAGAARAAAV